MINNYPDVTVIIPVYRVEDYLDKCIGSVMNQTHSNIEIILVDDGSPDNSGVMCDKYAELDSRIKVIHKKNGGLSDARNHGLEIAQGKYTLFVDSDDYIKTNAIETLYAYAENENLDIVSANAYQVKEGNITTLFSGYSEDVVDGKTFLVESIKNKKYLAAVWLRLYKTNLLKRNNLFFKVGLLHEDEQWTPYVLMNATRVGYLDYSFYYYLIRSGSITQMENREKHIKDIIGTCNELVDYFNETDLQINQKAVLKDYFARLYMNTVTFGKYDKKAYRSIINKKFVYNNSKMPKTKMQAVLYCISEKIFRDLKINRMRNQI